MLKKLLTPLTAQDKSDKKMFRTLLKSKTVDRPAITTLVETMSERIKPKEMKWTAKGLPSKTTLTEDLKTEYTAARAKFYDPVKPKRKKQSKVIPIAQSNELNIDGITYIRKPA